MIRAAIWVWAGLMALWAAGAGANTAHAPEARHTAAPVPASAPVAVRTGPQPAEAPPDDFTGSQYIDSAGCVFLRGAGGWTARLGPDNAPVCGWPPSRAARRTDPDTVTVLAPSAPPAPPPGPEEVLMQTLAQELRDGEWSGDHRTPEKRAPAPLPTPAEWPLAELAAMVAAAPTVSTAMAAPGLRDDRLCRLLGGEGARPGTPTLGADPTAGFCPGLAPIVLPGAALDPVHTVSRDAEGHDAEKGPTHADAGDLIDHAAAAKKPDPEAAHTSEPAPQAVTNASAPKKTTPPASPRSQAKPAPKSARKPAVTVEMIPASARFVTLGAFDSAQAAQTVSERVASLGYPVAKGRVSGAAETAGRPSPTVILAGPFADRRAIVAALNDLRGRGYAAQVAP